MALLERVRDQQFGVPVIWGLRAKLRCCISFMYIAVCRGGFTKWHFWKGSGDQRFGVTVIWDPVPQSEDLF